MSSRPGSPQGSQSGSPGAAASHEDRPRAVRQHALRIRRLIHLHAVHVDVEVWQDPAPLLPKLKEGLEEAFVRGWNDLPGNAKNSSIQVSVNAPTGHQAELTCDVYRFPEVESCRSFEHFRNGEELFTRGGWKWTVRHGTDRRGDLLVVRNTDESRAIVTQFRIRDDFTRAAVEREPVAQLPSLGVRHRIFQSGHLTAAYMRCLRSAKEEGHGRTR